MKKRLLNSLCLWTVITYMGLNLSAQEKPFTKLDALSLWPGHTIDQNEIEQTINETAIFTKVTVPLIIPYLPPKEIANGTSVIICPGGGYHALAWKHHVENLAPLFTSKGIAVIGLRYRTVHPGNTIPADSLKDFNQAINLVRKNAQAWNLDADKIVGLGFSAGSNLLLQYACQKEGEKIKYLNFLCLWPYFQAADSYKLQKNDLDVILFTADQDKIAPSTFSAEMTDIFNKSGSKATLIRHTQGNHAAYNFYGNKSIVNWTDDFFKWLDQRGLLAKK